MEIESKSIVDFKVSRRFKVALSFPGEHRELVEKIADGLVSDWGKEQILYDKYHRAELARLNLDTYLQGLYSCDSDMVVVFICDNYQDSTWCGIEWRAIRKLMNQKDMVERIMFIRCGTGMVDGIFDSVDGYIDSNNVSVDEIVSDIIKRHGMIISAQLPQRFFSVCKKIVETMKEEAENEISYFSISDEDIKSVKSLFDSGLYIEPNIDLKISSNSNKPTIIIGKGGYGKSLFLIKRFIDAADKFLISNDTDFSDISVPFYCQIRKLDESTKTILDFIDVNYKSYKKYFDSEISLKISFYLDGLDELKQDFYKFTETDIFKNCILITSREYFYNEKQLLDFFLPPANIGKWNDSEIKNFIEKYCQDKNIRERAINFICGKNNGIFSPLLISLFLYIIEENHPWGEEADDCLIEVSILNGAIKKYIKREIGKNKDSIIVTTAITIIAEACWLHYKYSHSNNNNNRYTYENYKNKISEFLKIDEKFVDKYIKIVLKEQECGVTYTIHEEIYEFLIAKRIIGLISQNREIDDIFSMNYKPEIFGYITSLCKYSGCYLDVAKYCKEHYTQKLEHSNLNNSKDLIFLIDSIMLYARSGLQGSEGFIIEQIKKRPRTDYTILCVLYDIIIQYADSVSTHQDYEEDFYNRLSQDEIFEKVHRGCRLTYYHCVKPEEGYIIKGDQGKCDWSLLFDKIKKHFQEQNHSDRHYFLRRVELLTIKKLLDTDHINNESPVFKEDLRTFLSKIKLELYEKAKKGDPFDIKAKECYDSHFNDFYV